MKFYLKGYHDTLSAKAIYPLLALVPNSWNDYNYITLYKLFYYETFTKREEIGDVKILDQRRKITQLSDQFIKLDENYCSLGQSIDYYKNIRKFLPKTFKKYLKALNDTVINIEIRDKFFDMNGYQSSLLRFSEAEKALYEGAKVLELDEEGITNDINFQYTVKLKNANSEHTVNFLFHQSIEMPFRIIVLIGKNGTGKTQFLSNLAASLCGSNNVGRFTPSRPLFSKVIAISFSLFDKFKVPKTSKEFSYKYIGFRTGKEILTADETNNRMVSSLREIEKQGRKEIWRNFISQIYSIDDYNNLNTLNISGDIQDGLNILSSETMSSGQNIIFFIITELIANIKRDSIILFDEPETHLHPNALTRLIKVINAILDKYSSYAIISTHSPLVVQETPSEYVRVFDRIGNSPLIKDLPYESFGENISKIYDTIFYRNQEKEVYKEYFDDKIKELSADDINGLFNNKLSFNSLVYLSAIEQEK